MKQSRYPNLADRPNLPDITLGEITAKKNYQTKSKIPTRNGISNKP